MAAENANIEVDGYSIYADTNNCHINDSYKADNIKELITKIRKELSENYGINYVRSESAWKVEWYAHNGLYRIGLFRDHTKDVDLNDDETTIRKIGYTLFYPFARIICAIL